MQSVEMRNHLLKGHMGVMNFALPDMERKRVRDEKNKIKKGEDILKYCLNRSSELISFSHRRNRNNSTKAEENVSLAQDG